MSWHPVFGVFGSLRKNATNRYLTRNAARLYGGADRAIKLQPAPATFCADPIFHLSDLFILRSFPSFIWFDNGSEFVAQAVQDWIKAVGANTAYIEPGSPWENGYCEGFTARFRDEFLNGEVLYHLCETQILIEEWNLSVVLQITCRSSEKHYNTKRPHCALGDRPPAPEAIVKMDQRPIMH